MKDPYLITDKKQLKGKIIKHYSAGGYVVYKKKILLIENKDTQSVGIPKGTIKKNEDKLTTATREIFEETGCSNLRLIKKLPSDSWSYKIPGKSIIKKTVYEFLFETTNDIISTDHQEENENLIPFWVDLKDADKIVTFPGTKKTIKLIQKMYF